MSPEPWVTVEQVAQHLGIHAKNVYPLLLRKQIRACKVGRSWRTKLSWVDEAVEAGAV